MPNGQAHYIVFANEKGGTGKSTTAVHVAVALATQGHKVGVIDLDPRQRTVTRYLENREETSRRRGVTLPTPTYAVFEGDTLDALQEQVDALTPGLDFLVVDTPGRDDEFAKYMAARDRKSTRLNSSH